MAKETVLDRLLRQGAAGGGQRAAAPPVTPPSGGPYETDIVLSRPAAGAEPKKKDDGFGVGDVFKPLGRLLSGAIDVSDVGRAAVASGLRETFDVAVPIIMGVPGKKVTITKNGETTTFAGAPSATDFFSQVTDKDKRLQTRDLLSFAEYRGRGAGTLGFIGDVATDPLTYTPIGVGRVAVKFAPGFAKNAGEAALRNAVRDGSSKGIAKVLAVNANDAGIFADEAVQRLIANAGTRGRAALTERGLKAAGIDDATRQALGLAVGQPGRIGVALQSFENVKGAAKETLRATNAAKRFRSGFIPKYLGRAALSEDIFNKNVNFGRRAQAIFASTSINPAKAAANKWSALAMERAARNLLGDKKAPKVWAVMSDGSKVTDDFAIQATRNVENGLTGEAEDVLRSELKTIHDELVAANVRVGDLGETYVPHIMTDEARDLARKNYELQRFFSSIMSEEGFQKFRSLRKGDKMFGEELKEGSIGEINEKFVARFGVKLFYDDARDILPRYIKQGERAVAKAKQLDLLDEMGFTPDLAKKMVVRSDKEFDDQVKQVRRQINAAKQAKAEFVGQSNVQRSIALKAAKAEVSRRIKVLGKQINDLETRLRDMDAQRVEIQSKIDLKNAEIGLVRQQIEDLTVAAQAARGEARRMARQRLKAAEKRAERQIRDANKEIGKLQSQVQKIFAGARTVPQVRAATLATRQLRESVDVMRATREGMREALDGELAVLRSQLDDIVAQQKATRIGFLPTELESALMNASNILEAYIRDKDNLMQAADYADAMYLYVQADPSWSVDALRRQLAELETVKDGLKGFRGVTSKKMDPHAALKDRFDGVMAVLQRQGNSPEVEAIAQLEAVAAKSDVAVWMAGKQEDLFLRMMDDLESRKMKEVFDDAADGMVKISETKQMPEWLFEATKMEWVRDELPNIGKYGRKYFNLFKGYAILRPGFHVRNLYSAMFNMYLEAGARSFGNVRRWHQFYTKATHDPEGYMKWAEETFGVAEAKLLDDALATISATGGGQAASEFGQAGFRKASKSPFDENNILFMKSRRAGGWVEDHVRGAHAYDLLKRGNTVDQAVDVVSKWHFDYTDITSFDEKMKLINPFWIFFSRNMALQSQTWVKNLPKVNRTIENFERNANYGAQEEGLVPQYYITEGATKLGVKGLAGSDLYLFTDLPAVTFPGEIDRFSDPTSARFFADLGPFLRIPFELAGDRQLFSDIPIDTARPAQLPLNIGNLPGVRNLGFLPGVDTAGSGELMMNPELLNVVRAALPGLGQLERVAPIDDPKLLERWPYTLASFFGGLSLVERTPRAQQGELMRRNFEEKARRDYLRRLQEG